MSHIASMVYRIALALWFGGMVVFSLVVTPAVFRTQPREVAARVVSALLPLYFRYAIVALSAALAARFAAGSAFIGPQPSLGTVILAVALAANLWQVFVLVPRMERIQARIPSYESRDAHHPARRAFGRLHAFSLTLNFLLMVAGALLLSAQDAFGP